MEADVLVQHELPDEPVLGLRPRLGQAGGERLPGHRLGDGIVERVEDHEGGDQAGCLGGVEVGGRQRDVHAPGDLARRGGRRRARRRQERQRGEERGGPR